MWQFKESVLLHLIVLLDLLWNYYYVSGTFLWIYRSTKQWIKM